MQYQISNFLNSFLQYFNEYGINLEGNQRENSVVNQNLLAMNNAIDVFMQSEEGQALEEIVTKNIEELYSNLYSSISSTMQTGGMFSQSGMFSQGGMFAKNNMQTQNGMQSRGSRRGGRRHNKGNALSQFNQGFPQVNNQWNNSQIETPQNQYTHNTGNTNWEINFTETPIYNNSSEIITTPSISNTTTQSEFDINESIEASQQGYVGDCWLLSGLNSLSYSEKGQQLINDAITINDDGSYTVTFAGIGDSVNITNQDLKQARQSGLYSTGDDDVLLMEVAFEKILDEIQNGNIKISGDTTNLSFLTADEGQISSLDGGWLSDMIYLLTGDDLEFITNKSSFTEFLDKMEANPDDYVAKLSFPSSAEGETDDYNTITDIYGNEIYELGSGGHAFAIKSVSNGVVTIVNPHDSSKEYQISYDELIYSARNIEYYKL